MIQQTTSGAAMLPASRRYSRRTAEMWRRCSLGSSTSPSRRQRRSAGDGSGEQQIAASCSSPLYSKLQNSACNLLRVELHI